MLPFLSFTSVIFSVVHIPPQADTDSALSEQHDAPTSYQANHGDAALIMARDFKSANLHRVLPNFCNTCPTGGEWTLDYCYNNNNGGYKV